MDTGAWLGWNPRGSSPSWSASGAEHVAELLAAEHAGAPVRVPEQGERVMVCYRSGVTIPGTVALAIPGEPPAVIVDESHGGTTPVVGLFPATILRPIVGELCVPLDVIEAVYLAERAAEPAL